MEANNLEEKVGCFDRTFVFVGIVITLVSVYSAVKCNYALSKHSIQKVNSKLEDNLNLYDKNIREQPYKPLKDNNK